MITLTATYCTTNTRKVESKIFMASLPKSRWVK